VRPKGIANAKAAAQSIVVRLDGAASVMLVHRDPTDVEAAGAVAASLVEPASGAAAG
jgi:pyridoxal biosynthesis lyase PdxS